MTVFSLGSYPEIDFQLLTKCSAVRHASASTISFAAMENAANLNDVVAGQDEKQSVLLRRPEAP